jgi:hypothetical protein
MFFCSLCEAEVYNWFFHYWQSFWFVERVHGNTTLMPLMGGSS